MKKNLIRIFIFVIPLVIAFVYIEYKLFKIPNSYSKKRFYLERNLEHIEVLCLGTSQILYGINPESLSHKTYNLGYLSQTLYYDKNILRKYIDKMPKLKVVFICVSYPTFFACNESNKIEEWRYYFYLHFWGIKLKDFPIADARRYSLLTLYTPEKTVDFMKKGFNVNLAETLDTNGYSRMDTTNDIKNISDSLGKVRVQLYNNMAGTTKEIKSIVTDFEEILLELKKKNINAVVITMPVYHTYYDNCLPQYLELNKKIINYMQNKYNFKYFNYFYDNRFFINDFLDNDHLNFIGATKMCKIIDSEIITPIYDMK